MPLICAAVGTLVGGPIGALVGHSVSLALVTGIAGYGTGKVVQKVANASSQKAIEHATAAGINAEDDKLEDNAK